MTSASGSRAGFWRGAAPPRRGALVRVAALGLAANAALVGGSAAAAEPTPGFPEPVVQWGVNPGETCEDVSRAVYGTPQHAGLVLRYNVVTCAPGRPLPSGTTLIMPATPTTVPTARLRSLHPAVRARAAGAAWGAAASGMPLYRNHSVNTQEEGRADIRFADRTRVVLAEHTLVVIYGSAAESSVARTRPPAVQLEEGEVLAGLAALRGDAMVAVEVAGGGSVEAASRDSVLKKRGDRTTVSVFQGSARVRSAGATVAVPTHHGSSFRTGKPPTPPRPLPPAPGWAEGTRSGVVVVPRGSGLLRAGWRAVPAARSYRVEVASDASFEELLAREEVPADVLTFRGEGFPPGTYHLRVRAIDTEDFLGLPSDPLEVGLVEVSLPPEVGALEGETLRVSPYAALEVGGPAGTEVALDDGPFRPAVGPVDLRSLRPRRVRVRRPGAVDSAITVQYRPLRARVVAARQARHIEVVVTWDGAEGLDVPRQVGPRLRLRQGTSTPREEALGAEPLRVPAGAGPVRLWVLDRDGRVLGRAEVPAAPVASTATVPARRRPVFLAAAPLPIAAAVDVAAWAPEAPAAITTDGLGALGADSPSAGPGDAASGRGVVAQWRVRASAAEGDLGFDLRMASAAYGERPVDGSAWVGARWRAFGGDAPAPSGGPSLRVGLPTGASSPGQRLEPGFALLWPLAGAELLGDVGARFALEGAPGGGVSRVAPFLVLGGTYDLLQFLRGYALLDAHGLLGDGSARARAGLSLGVETTGELFAGLGLRGTPWADAGGLLSGQLAVGWRAP